MCIFQRGDELARKEGIRGRWPIKLVMSSRGSLRNTIADSRSSFHCVQLHDELGASLRLFLHYSTALAQHSILAEPTHVVSNIYPTQVFA